MSTKQSEQTGWPIIFGFGFTIFVMMALELWVAATGVARYMESMGCDIWLGYGIGAALDLAKDFLLGSVLALWAHRARGLALAFGLAWACLVIGSCLATHATITTFIASNERTGSWKMEVRTNAKIELSTIEQQVAALSRPTPPRPVKTVRESLNTANVPPAIWKDSRECAEIRGDPYMAKACAQHVQLRRELAASEDYERLSLRAGDIRKTLAEVPILATADPLPSAFSATLGRVLRIDGADGIALLYTMALELISVFGLAGLRALCREGDQQPATGTYGSRVVDRQGAQGGEAAQSATKQHPSSLPSTLPEASLKAALAKQTRSRPAENRPPRAPSNVVPIRPRAPSRTLPERDPESQTLPGAAFPQAPSHVSAFAQQRLQRTLGPSLAAKELRTVYEAWCAAQGYQPLSMPKLAAELTALGYTKWKSNGLIRYRNLQLVA